MASVSLMLYMWMLHSSLGYPSGAPADTCETMGPPEHGAPAQTNDPPYTIITSSKRYNCGEKMRVTVGAQPGFFRGFLCQARTVRKDYSTTVGNLTQFGTRVIMNQTCGNGRALSHSEHADKNIAEFSWMPFENYGTVYFVCTIVQSKDIYWVRKLVADVVFSNLGSCTKPSTINKQISTESDTSTTVASSSVSTTDSTKSETPTGASTTDSAKSETPTSASTTDSTKSETHTSASTTDSTKYETPASASTTKAAKSETPTSASTTDSTKFENHASTSTTDSTKSETPTTAYTTDSAKSETPSDSASTNDSRTENQTNNRSIGVLLTSNPSSSFHLFNNNSNIQAMSTLGIVGRMASMNPKRSKRLCRSSAGNIRVHELLILTCYFLI